MPDSLVDALGNPKGLLVDYWQISILQRDWYGKSTSRLLFTEQELHYLDSHPKITFSEINWQPLSIIKQGEFSGLMNSYLEIITEKTGIEFEYVAASSWPEVLTLFADKKIDMIPGVSDYMNNKLEGLVSEEYAKFNLVIVTDATGNYIDDMKDFDGGVLAIPRGFTSYDYIKRNYPQLRIIATKSVAQALNLVATGKADGFVGHLAVAVNQIENYFPKLKIVGVLDYHFSHRMLVQRDSAVLHSILNKVFLNIELQQHQQIRQRWFQRKISTAVDDRIIYQLMFTFTVILLLLYIFFKKLSRANVMAAAANDSLMLSNKALAEQKSSFETLFDDSPDGLLIFQDMKFINCNNAVISMLQADSKSQVLNSHLLAISPLTQPDGENSELRGNVLFRCCLADGQAKFEWMLQTFAGKALMVDVVMNKIRIRGRSAIHISWRDIGDKKRLQQQIAKRNARLEKTNKELEQSLADLQTAQQQLIEVEKFASLGGLVAGIAHEINTPVGIGLTGITYLDDITRQLQKKYQQQKMSKLDFEGYLSDATEATTLIYNNLERTAQLVRSFKQISVDQSSDERRTFNLADYINEVMISLANLLRKNDVCAQIKCPPNIVLNSYPGAISQIISNLIINSTIHGFTSNSGGLITIEVSLCDEEVTLIYRDNGRGIKSEHLGKIFEPFFTTNREKGGSGLGLNIIYNIITKRLAGSIKCKSELGKGVEFIIKMNVNVV